MAREIGRPIVVTSQDLERLRLLLDSTLRRRRWEELHLRALADELEGAEVVDPEQVPGDVVTMRSRVRAACWRSAERPITSKRSFVC